MWFLYNYLINSFWNNNLFDQNIGNQDTEAAAIIFWHPSAKSWAIIIGYNAKNLDTTCYVNVTFMSQSYWKFTGDKVMVLEASNRMVPLMTVSFLRSLHQYISGCWSGISCNFTWHSRLLNRQGSILVFHLPRCRIQYDPSFIPFP